MQKLLSEGEGWTVEYKECRNSLSNSVFETICSFSNRYGGYILLGVADNGTVQGVKRESVGGIKKNFANMLNNPQKISPSMFLALEEIEIDGKLILSVYVPVGSQVELCSGKVYDRNADGDFEITKSTDLVANMYNRKSSLFSEREIFPYATENDLRLDDLIPRVKKMAVNTNRNHPWQDMSDMELLRSAGLYEEDKRTGKTGFNLAAILLFGRDEVIRSCASGYLTDALLRRENLDRYDDRLMVETNLIDAYDLLMEFVAKHTMDKFFLVGDQRVSVRSWIAREVVSNILVHREYTGTFLAKIVIENERMYAENWNRSFAQGRIDPNNFTPQPKNPVLSRFFVNIGRADQLGSGVRNLYKYTRIYSDTEPELIEGDIFRTIVPLYQSEVSDKSMEVSDKSMEVSDKSMEVSDKQALMEWANSKLNAAEIAFLESVLPLFEKYEWINTLLVNELSEKPLASVRRNLKRLSDIQILEASGANKNRRYRLGTSKNFSF